MAMASIAAGADGLLLEVHVRPDAALCDGPQSLTHDMLDALLRDLASPPIRALARSPVAFQGEHGAFSEQAAREVFGAGATLPCRDFRDVFDAVENGAAPVGIVPIENSLGGSIPIVYDLLAEHTLHVVGETRMRIVQNLIAHPGVALSEIRRIYAHPQAAAQCERFLRRHPEWTLYQVYDTAGSVRMIRDENARDAAAIAGVAAADGMAILQEQIESDPCNVTRFLHIARHPTTGNAGLITFTGPLAEHRSLNLTRIESRPIPGRPWEYRFFADLEGDLDSLPGDVRVLGRYKR
jgi:prephenate dehydratase